jgi:hypothetical protein
MGVKAGSKGRSSIATPGFGVSAPGCGVGLSACGTAGLAALGVLGGGGATSCGCGGTSRGCTGGVDGGALGVSETTGRCGSSGAGVGSIPLDGGEGSFPRGGNIWPEGIPDDGKVCIGGSGHCGTGACGRFGCTCEGGCLCVSIGGGGVGAGVGGGFGPVVRDPFESPSEDGWLFAPPDGEFVPGAAGPFPFPSEVFGLYLV